MLKSAENYGSESKDKVREKFLKIEGKQRKKVVAGVGFEPTTSGL
jgi:hypothetical protein